MATYTNIDIQRIFDSPANLATRMINGQFAYDTINDRLAVKRLADGVMKYFANNTDDTYLNADGTTPLTGDWDAGGFDITNVNILDVDNLTVTESMSMSSKNITNVLDPVSAQDAATKAYVDAQVTASDLDFAGDTGTGAIDLDSEVLGVVGASGELDTAVNGNTVTVGLDATLKSQYDAAYSHIHNLTTDIDHNQLTNTHNLTTDINHDNLTGFVANEHINHTSVLISSGTGLTGGGDISSSRTLSLSHLGIEGLTDPGADRIMFWDESENAMKWLTVSTGLSISTTSLSCSITQYTDENAQDAIGTILADSSSVNFTYTDATPEITAVVLPAGVDHNSLNNTHNLTTDINHDNLTGFVTNEHINHTSVSISAGTGLTGGGDISANRTLSLSHLGIESLTDPGADRIMFWDDSETALKWLIPGTGLSISTTSLNCSITQYTDELAQDAIGTILADSSSIDFTYTDATPEITAVVIPGGVDHDSLLNTHNLTTDINHNTITNGHNLTTDINHDALTGFVSGEHFLQSAITAISSSVGSGILKTASGTLSVITDNSSNWDAAYSHISADGTSHTYIDQDMRTTADVQFAEVNVRAQTPVIKISDANAATNEQATGMLEFYRDTVQIGYVGYPSEGNEHIDVNNMTSNGSIRFWTNNTQAMILDDDAMLELKSDTPILKLNDTNATTNEKATGKLDFYWDTTQIGSIGFVSEGNEHININNMTSNGSVRFWTNNTVQVLVDKDGNLNVDNLTASRLVFTDASKNLVSDTSGVTSANLTSMLTHISSTGTDHTYINQDLRTTADVTFNQATITNDLIVDTDTLFVDASLNRVGINDATPSYDLDVSGTIRATTNIKVDGLSNDRIIFTNGSGLMATPSSTSQAELEAAVTHTSSNGTDHTYINQDMRTTATVTHANIVSSGYVKVDGTLALNRKDQTITSDNDTLLDVSGTSFLLVQTSTSGSPTSYTVGIEAGDYDGHIVCIVAEGADEFEINDSVSGSADTAWSGNTLTVTTRYPVTLIWEDNYDTWKNIHPIVTD